VGYKLLAVDIDGTLVRRDGTTHPDDRGAIERLRASGVAVTIVTGRLYSGARAIARTAGLAGPIACVEGASIVDLNDDAQLFYRAVTGEHAGALRAILARHALASYLFVRHATLHDVVVLDAAGAPFASYVRTWSPDVEIVESVLAHPAWQDEHGLLALVSVGPEPLVDALAAQLGAELAERVLVVSFRLPQLPGTAAALVRAAGCTKGTAVGWLAHHHGCSPAEVVVVGDWLNDLPMFAAAGRSFAMGQSPRRVKEAATDVLAADGEIGGGIAEVAARAWPL
jgi:hydroxymethylpyrimidine pyrophosphatase-like HAD family hydrolase